MMAQRVWFRGFAIALAVLASTAARAEQPILSSFTRAKQIIDAAVEGAGGQKLIGMRQLSYRLRGDAFSAMQAYDPTIMTSRTTGPYGERNFFDFANERYYQEWTQELPGGFDLRFGTLYRDGVGYSIIWNERTYTQSAGSPAIVLDSAAQFIPALVLRRAKENYQSAAWLGSTTVDGREADELEFSWDATTRIRLLVDKSDASVFRVQTISSDPLAGDTTLEYHFEGAQRIGGVAFPQRVRLDRRGARNLDLAVSEITVDTVLPEDVLRPPTSSLTRAPDVTPTYSRLGPTVVEVSGIGGGFYRSYFLELADFLVAVDTPASFGATRQAALLAEARTSKPVRYVVITHFHSDHASGVGYYADRGVKVVAARPNFQILRAFNQARSFYAGQKPLAPSQSIDLIDPGSRYRITDDAGKFVEIQSIEGSPHVRSMLLVLDPQSNTYVNGDLYSSFTPFNETFNHFARWLERRGITRANVVGSHHAPVAAAMIIEEARRYRASRK